MRDRAMVSLMPAIAAGFIGGLIAAVLQFNRGPAITLGVVLAAFAVLLGLLSVAGVRAPADERTIVAVLRGLLAAAIFALLYIGMIAFLRDGHIVLALALWIAAGICTRIAAPLHSRTRAELHRQ